MRGVGARARHDDLRGRVRRGGLPRASSTASSRSAGTLIDTADVYAAGLSESIIGRWLARQPADVRDRVVLATKGRFPLGDGPNAAGLSRKHLRRRPRRVAAAARGRAGRPLPGARLRPAHPAGRDPALPRRRRPRRARSTTRACRTSPAGRCSEPSTWPSGSGLAPLGHAAAAVQPARAGDRVGGRARSHGQRARAAALVAARRGLAHRQVHPRRAPHRRHPAG